MSAEFLVQGLFHARVRNYYDFMVDVAVIYGANQSTAESEMRDVLQFEMQLAWVRKRCLPFLHNEVQFIKIYLLWISQIAKYAEVSQNVSALWNVFNMTSLQETFPFLDWRDYINSNLRNAIPIYENETIYVTDVDFLRQLQKLIDKTSKRTLANHFGMRLTLCSADVTE